jgi:hypothetical protein
MVRVLGPRSARPIVRAVSADDGSGHDGSIPGPEQTQAFRAFRRPATEADRLPANLLKRLPSELEPSSARRVCSGNDGQAFIVAGQDSVCFVSVSVTIGNTLGTTTTELAAEGGVGIIHSGAGQPFTFAGVLPTDTQSLEIFDPAGRVLDVPLNVDDGYWVQIPDAIDMVVTRRDGTKRHIPFGRGSVRQAP